MDKQDYEVGYGKPPKSSRFTKGKSGNPKGRPKGKRNVATVLNAVLNEKVIINENGRKRSVTKLEASVKQMVNQATTGNIAYMRLLMQLVPAVEAELADSLPTLFNNADDKQLLANLLERTQSLNAASTPATQSEDKENNP